MPTSLTFWVTIAIAWIVSSVLVGFALGRWFNYVDEKAAEAMRAGSAGSAWGWGGLPLNLDLFVQAVTADDAGTYKRALMQLHRVAHGPGGSGITLTLDQADAWRFLDFLSRRHWDDRFVMPPEPSRP